MKATTALAPIMMTAALLVSCKPASTDPHAGHDHAEGEGHEESAAKEEDPHDHDHGEEMPIGEVTIGETTVEAAQMHGVVEAGKEGHLVIKLPYNDSGATVLRAWIGTEDRTLSSVGKGVWASGHDDYDVHLVAPDPLPEGGQWWLEIEKPDGSKSVGSFPFH
ncbi:MAG: hypothetical protein ACSHYB_18200 [Roseibacillus sp.]